MRGFQPAEVNPVKPEYSASYFWLGRLEDLFQAGAEGLEDLDAGMPLEI
jgi:hypothetical protein